ncbi:hypothetical protein [Chitinophaga sp. sic0106]|uniref:hypothetical protein n=1 Tax=Chitinophaga sp. sic0106 TaxID=2854785 RepID=UPI001C440F72|nr:hypothetical protein [Chitinophaga sp. sic0106]MBV7531042.1 hypothetical protein [Chitinophaga sp. sic0106]
MKSVSVPSELVAAPFNHRSLQLNGFSAIESCTHADCTTGSMFLEEHMLLYVAKGQNIVTYGKQTFPVRENEMLLVKKASLIQYNKTGIPASGYVYESILFFLKDEFIQDFVRMADITAHKTGCSPLPAYFRQSTV